MSWQATNWVIEKSAHKGSALLTMLMIANCSNEDGTDAFPSTARLARDTRMSIRQVLRIIETLETSGELGVKRSDGRFPNHYSFPLMNSDKMSLLKKKPTVTKPRPNSDISTTNSDIAMSLDPSVDPPVTDPLDQHPPTPQRGNDMKTSREPASADALDDKSHRYSIEELESPVLLNAIHGDHLRATYPELPFNVFYLKWWRSRMPKGGVKRRSGEKATLRQYAVDLEGFFDTCDENRKKASTNGNGTRYESAIEKSGRNLLENLAGFGIGIRTEGEYDTDQSPPLLIGSGSDPH